MFYSSQSIADNSLLFQIMLSKLVILLILITATLWCGKIYKGFMHLSTLNKHRALSLQTFQAFSQATKDPHVKDAVLLETTRSIFGNVSSGFLDVGPKNPDSNMKVLEMIKSVAKIDSE